MSRSGYSEDWDFDQWAMIRWRGAVTAAIKGKRGQAFLREMLAALDALPDGKLVASELEENGQVCALGAVGRARGVDMAAIDPEDYSRVAATFGVSEALAREVVYENDEMSSWGNETPEQRFWRMRRWVASQIRSASQP